MRVGKTAPFVFLAVFLSIPAFGQDTSSFTGTVRDSSGAIVPNAKVVVTDRSTGVDRPSVTNSQGDYLVAGLPSGTYDIIVTVPGFKKFEANGVALDAAQKLRVDVALQVGTVAAETVVVNGGEVAQVEGQSSELATTVTSTQINQLELNGRVFTGLLTLVPGVTNGGTRGEQDTGLNGSATFDVNGGRNEYNNFELDGGAVQDAGSNASLNLYPSLDSISEVRVMTSNYGAQYGLNGSGTIEIVTKSGTDQFHGDLYYYGRNEDLNANNWFNNASGIPRPQYRRNDFGYTLGGPVTMPGHYNTKRDKTFFFWSEEWHYYSNPTTFDQGVPSDADPSFSGAGERAGDFTDVCSNSVPYAVGGVNPYGDYCPAPLQANIPNNGPFTLPATDPVGQAFLSKIPHATETGLAAVNDSGCLAPACYKASVSVPEYWREELIRVDHNLSSKERLMGRYTHDSWNTFQPGGGVFGTGSSTFQTFENQIFTPGTSLVLHLTSTFSPTLVNEFLASYNQDSIRFVYADHNAQALPPNFGPGQEFQGLFPNQGNGTFPGVSSPFGGKIPGISVSSADTAAGLDPNDPYSFGFTNDPGPLPWNNSAPTYNYKDTITKNMGNHNFAFGATFVAYEKNEPGVLEDQGVLTFTNQSNPISTGNVIADMLLGEIQNYTQTSSFPKYHYRYKILEPFFQDDWRVNKHLTLNLGFHVSLFGTARDISKQSYDFVSALYSASTAPTLDFDGSVTGQPGALIPNTGNPFDGMVQCGGPGGSFGPASAGGSVSANKYPGCMAGHLFNPAPRIGFAWDPRGDGKTAIRGGYGIFFEHQNGDETNAESLESTPPLSCTPQQFLISGYANVGGGGGTNACNGSGVLFPLNILGGPPDIIPTVAIWPNVQQWNLDVEREIFPNTVLTVAYAGSKGTHLALQTDINQVLPTPASQNPYPKGQAISQNDCNTLTATNSGGQIASTGTIVGPNMTENIPVSGQAGINLAVACGGAATANGSSGDFPNGVRPLLGFGDLNLVENEANSNYNALQISLHRNTGPLILSIAYTYSHSLDDSSDRYDGTFVNSYDLEQNYASSNFDQRHVLNISYVYDLPFFKSAGLLHTFLGGWQLSGITSWQTGTPISITPSNFGDAAGVANGVGSGAYADVVGNPKAVGPCTGCPSTLGPLLFNQSAFAFPQGLTFGDSGRNFLNRPPYSNWDMGLFKKFAVTESKHFEFRTEAFNVFNEPEFNGVSTSVPTVLGPTSHFLHANSALPARILQLALKFVF
jgi:hypothetical protein